MIDVHVLTHSKTKREWLDQCLGSLLGEPCTVHVLQGVERDIKVGRHAAFQLGTHDYVSFVDSDDYVLPGAVGKVLEALESGLHAVVSDEQVVNHVGKPAGVMSMHHLFACRRAVMNENLNRWVEPDGFAHCSHVINTHIKPVRLPFVGYVYRLHNDQSIPHVLRWHQEKFRGYKV